jgi:small subunit ribosomal protein S16
MVRIRLRRVGLKHQPSYRIIAADKEAPRDGRFLEILGFYNPRTDPATIEIKEDRLFDWMSKGAQPSESVVKLMNSIGATERFNRFKAGESMDTLKAEAVAASEKRGTSTTTRETASK